VTFNGIFSEFLGFHHSADYSRAGHSRHCRYRQGGGKDAGNHNVGGIRRHLFSGFLSYFTGVTLFPSMIAPGAPIEQISEAHDISPFFTVGIPPVMNVMTSLILPSH